MKLLGIGDNVLDDYRWRQELYPGGNSVNVPVLARRYDGSTAAYIGVLADDGAGLHFASALREEGVDISRVRVMRAIPSRWTRRATATLWATTAGRPRSTRRCCA